MVHHYWSFFLLDWSRKLNSLHVLLITDGRILSSIQETLALANMVFNEFLVISKKISPSFLTIKSPIQNLGLTNTAFDKFLFMPNKNIGFLLKFYLGFSKQYHIFKSENLFATFESLRSVEFPMQTISFSFSIICFVTSNYIVVTSTL